MVEYKIRGRGALIDNILVPFPVITIRGDIITNISLDQRETGEYLDYILLPGLIDLHTHITYTNSRIDNNSPIDNVTQTLEAGFTTIRNQGDERGLDLKLRDMIKNREIIGPRIFASGRPIIKGNKSCESQTLDAINSGCDHIKIFNEGIPYRELCNITAIAKKHGKQISCHCLERDLIIESSRAGCDYIEHGYYLTDKAATTMVEQGTALVPTLSNARHYLNNYKKFDISDSEFSYFHKIVANSRNVIDIARRNNVSILFGSDAIAGMHGHNADEFKFMKECGMDNLEMITAATKLSGEFLHLNIGKIQSGYSADLIGVSNNPLLDITELSKVKIVFSRGLLIKW
jgi:imidazolonepropionase-like amidohydrolase